MAIIGKTDEFEHRYKQKFRDFAGQFGRFVFYEEDIAKRDIGLHLTKPLRSGAAKVTSSLCWFQLKGLMVKTLPRAEAEKASSFKQRLDVEHLQFWFLQPMPTYLGLYVESLDRFFILNLKKYVEEKWGRDILSFPQKTVDVEVSASSVLDRDAFNLILRQSTVEDWTKALSADESQVKLCERDYKIIWRLGTASERNVEHRVEIFDWQSKTRGEVHIQERAKADESDWETIRNHWQFMLSIGGVEEMYPYLNFAAAEEGESRADDYEEDEDGTFHFVGSFDDDEEDYRPRFELRSGQVALGDDCAGEYHLYYLIPELNDRGLALMALIKTLMAIKFIELDDDEPGEFLSVAPWHSREV